MQAIMSMRDPYLSKSLLDEFLIKNTEASYILKVGQNAFEINLVI